MRGSVGSAVRSAWESREGRLGTVILLALVIVAAVGPPFLADPATISDAVAGAQGLSPAHPLGTDHLSRDVLARVVVGARISLTIAALAVALSVTLGALVGLISGYLGGIVDTVLMRFVDGALAIPRLFLLLLLVMVWEQVPIGALILVLGGTGWLGTSRVIRGEVLRLREEPFVMAARAIGASPWRIITKHLFPNVTGPLLVAATLGLGDVILIEAGLSFLGLGVQPPTPSWGGMILEARPVLLSAPWTSIVPGTAILITVLAANLISDALQAALEPRGA